MRTQQVSNMPGDRVDIVPPGATGDDLFVYGERVGCPAVAMPPITKELDCGVTLLTKLRFAPQLQHRRAPFIAALQWVVGKDALGDGSHVGGRDAPIGHLRFHVCLHSRSSFGVGGRSQRGTHRRPECGHGAGM
jgi:hypothetical protein